MRIVCPSCEATYDVPNATLGAAPRQVRCAKCGTVWGVDPTPEPVIEADAHDDADLPPPVVITPEIPPPPPGAAQIAATHRLPTTSLARRRSVAPAIAWLVSLAVLTSAAWAFVVWRVPIMQVWAPSRRLYQWLGLG